MKSLARMYTWRPKIDEDIKRAVKGCTKCQDNKSNLPSVPLQPWKWAVRPWPRLHMVYL